MKHSTEYSLRCGRWYRASHYETRTCFKILHEFHVATLNKIRFEMQRMGNKVRKIAPMSTSLIISIRFLAANDSHKILKFLSPLFTKY
jgi:hypothetical protein